MVISFDIIKTKINSSTVKIVNKYRQGKIASV